MYALTCVYVRGGRDGQSHCEEEHYDVEHGEGQRHARYDIRQCMRNVHGLRG